MTVVAALHPLSGLAQLHVGAVFFYKALWSPVGRLSHRRHRRVCGQGGHGPSPRPVALTVTSMSTYQTAFWFSVAYAVLGVLVSFRLAPSRTRC